MHTSLKHAMLTGASLVFLALSSAALPSSTAQAGPLSVAPRQDVAPAALTETVQYGRRGVRAVTIRPGVRYARGGYYYRRGYNNGFFPAAALGLFAGVLGAATWGATTAYCDPYYYTWNYCGGSYPAYYGASYYPAYYGGGYYPAYYGGGYYPAYYPAYRTRRVVYRNAYGPRAVYRNAYGPRVVHYRGVGPRTHLIGTRTFVRSGYTVRSARHGRS
ncbi:MAG: hypothetical protein K2Y29_09090 [Beijerinckiaceae bacterium]|nr:hypothetical protein [Beijerinckiaceae bacterium]